MTEKGAAAARGQSEVVRAGEGAVRVGRGTLVGLWGNFGTENFGNECSLHAMMVNVRRLAPGSRFIVVCSQPADTRERHGVDAVPISPDTQFGMIRNPSKESRVMRMLREIRDVGRVFRMVRRLDHLVMPGTGLLTDAQESILGMPYQMLKWTVAARLCGKPVSFVSVGAESLVHPVKSRFICFALRIATYRSYRDAHSRDRVGQRMSLAKADPLCPDLAFSLPRSLMGTKPRQAAAAGTSPVVAVGLYGVDGGPAAVASYVETIGRFAEHLLGRGYVPRLVYGDGEYDEAVFQQVTTWIESRGLSARVISERVESFETLMGQIAASDLMVATRFHNILLAMLLGKPVVSVSHMDKNDQLMEMMGMSDFTLPLAEATPDSLAMVFARLEAARESVHQRLVERGEQFREELEAQYRLLFGDAFGSRADSVAA
jgi:polysaccharide pyruvyl transferase WcaK-like protein